MEKISSDPFLDWVLVLVVGLFVFIALVVLDISVYLDSTDSLKSSPTQVGKPQKLPLDEKLLDKVLGEYEARASKHSTLMRSYTAPSDPSLP